MYIVSLQSSCSEALLTQAKRKISVFRSWWYWEQKLFGRCLRSKGRPF